LRWLRTPSISLQLFATPILAIVLFAVVLYVVIQNFRDQDRILADIQVSAVERLRNIASLSSTISSKHVSLSAVLGNAGQKIDEAELYDRAKPILNDMFEIETALKERSAKYVPGGVDAALYARLKGEFIKYRSRAVTAVLMTSVDMTSVDLNRSRAYLTQANADYQRLIVLLADLNRNALGRANRSMDRIKQTSKRLTNNIILFLMLGAIGSLFLSWLISRFLTRQFRSLIHALSALAREEEAVDILGLERSDEVGAMAKATLAFQGAQRRLQIEVGHSKAIEAELRSNEERLAKIFSASPNLVTVTRLKDGMYRDVNDKIQESTGYTRDEVIGRTVTELGIWADPEDRGRFVGVLNRDGNVRGFEAKLGHKSDQPRDFIIAAEQADLDGEDYILATAVDITERKQAEEEVRQDTELAHLMQRITIETNEASSIAASYKICLDGVCDHTGWPVGHVYVRAPETEDHLVSSQIWHLNEPEHFAKFKRVTESTEFDAGIGLPGRVLERKQPVWITDVTKDRNFPRAEFAKDIGVKGAFAFPVISKGSVVAVMEFFSEVATSADDPILKTLTELCAGLGPVIERKQTEEALRASEERFRTFVDNSPMPSLVKDLDGRFRIVNRAFAEIYGWSMDDIIGKTSHELFSSNIANAFRLEDSNVLETEQTVEAEHRFELEDGSKHWIVTTKFPVYDGDRRIVGIGGMSVDITERRKAEDALKASEERFRAAVAYSPLAFMIKDLDGKISFVNDSFVRWFGMPSQDAIGATSDALFKKETAEALIAVDREVLASRGAVEQTLDSDFADGTVHALALTKFPLFDGNHQIIGIGAITTDITEIRRANELEVANKHLQELDRLKSMFIASMSHELRTPLNSIIGFSGIMLNEMLGPMTQDQSDKLSRINRSAKHLLDLISDVIDISKIEAGRLEVQPERFRVQDIVEESVEACRSAFDAKGLALEIDALSWPVLFQDRRRVLQCLLNLVSNAAKYSDAGKVVITIRESDGWVDIAVRDSGIGISTGDLRKLFEPFERLDSHLRIAAGGTGLGLYLTKKIVEEMLKGTIAVKSRQGEGSTFTLHIPATAETSSIQKSKVESA